MLGSAKRVVITGLGVISPLGLSLDELWGALKSQQSGISDITSLPSDAIPVRHGGQVKCFTGAIEDFGPMEKNLQRAIKKSQKVMCREIELGVAACQRALTDSRLIAEQRDPDRTGITYGCDYILTRPEEYADGVLACHDAAGELHRDQWPTIGMSKVNPLWLLKYLPNMPASHVAIFNDLRGPSNSLTVREASSSLTIAEAVAGIRRGAADIMIVGATGSRLEPLRYLHVSRQEQLARDRDPPASMARPYAIDRDGVVLGEGAAAFILEAEESAIKRGAHIYGEVLATAASAVGPRQGRDHIRIATANVLSRLVVRCKPLLDSGDWHLHVAGRGDPRSDRSEASGIADVFGEKAKTLTIVSANSYFGSLGAGGPAVEQIASLLALEHDELFATLNQEAPDPSFPMRLSAVPSRAGRAFLHLAYSPQGQASGVCIAKYA